MTRKLPLAGVRIADMSTVVFGPYCTQILADLGADVIKVEPAEGDTVRNVGTPAKTPLMGPVYLRLNRGKRSASWDMKSEKGKRAVQRLLETSDVFIHNIRPDAIDRLGLGYDAVRKLRPDIIYVHCTGFALGGLGDGGEGVRFNLRPRGPGCGGGDGGRRAQRLQEGRHSVAILFRFHRSLPVALALTARGDAQVVGRAV